MNLFGYEVSGRSILIKSYSQCTSLMMLDNGLDDGLVECSDKT